MEPATVSSCILTLNKRFSTYTTQRLQELGLSFGLMYFVIYVGKHPDCSPSELTKDLHLDWGALAAQPDSAGRRWISDP